MKTLSYDQLKKMKDQNKIFLLINVLPGNAFEEKNIQGSINIPLEQPDFENWVEKAAGGKEKKIIVHCASFDCPASKNAAEKLEKAGFTDVSAYEGGTKEWQKKSGQSAAA